MEIKEILCCAVCVFVSLVFLVILLIPPFQYLKDRHTAKDKEWWRKNKRFHIYYREVIKLKKKNPDVDIIKAEWELKRNTVRRMFRIRLEEFFLGGGLAIIYALLDMSSYKGEPWEEPFALVSIIGLLFELCGVLGFARDMHDAATPMDAERDYQSVRRHYYHTEILCFDEGEFPPEENIKQRLKEFEKKNISFEWIFGLLLSLALMIFFGVIKHYLGLIISTAWLFIIIKEIVKNRKEKRRYYNNGGQGYELEKCRCTFIENGDVYRIYTDKNDFYVLNQSPFMPQVGDEIYTVSFEKNQINCAYIHKNSKS